MAARPHLTGQKFNRLYVTCFYGSEHGSRCWVCRCDCGVLVVVSTYKLLSGAKQSCGCLQKEVTGARRRTHGKSRTPEHKVWDDMKARCLNPNATGYADYGGRGIKVCDRWLNSFEAFLHDMGQRPTGTSLDRIDVNGDYEPGNCRWVSWKEQQRNKRSTKLVTVNGVTASLAEHCERTGMRYGTVLWRLRAGWSVEKAFSDTYRQKRKELEKQDVD
jgi:hypothetical protein